MTKRPLRIRIMIMIYYFVLVMTLMTLLTNTGAVKPDDTAYEIPYVPIFSNALAAILTIYYLSKRRLVTALLTSFMVFFLSFLLLFPLGALLALIALLMYIPRATRDYLRSGPAFRPAIPVPAAESGEGEPAAETEEESGGSALPAPAPAVQRQTLTRSNREYEVYIREATADDALSVYSIMMQAFQEYKHAVPPSSALDEKESDIAAALAGGDESAAILFEDDVAVAMVRFRFEDDAVDFYRLSVIPPKRRRGYAKMLVRWIEHHAISHGKNVSRCRVRQAVTNNLALYTELGYEIAGQELVMRPAGSIQVLHLTKKISL